MYLIHVLIVFGSCEFSQNKKRGTNNKIRGQNYILVFDSCVLWFGSCLLWFGLCLLWFGSCLLWFGSCLFSAQVKEFYENQHEPNIFGIFWNCAWVKTAPLKSAGAKDRWNIKLNYKFNLNPTLIYLKEGACILFFLS